MVAKSVRGYVPDAGDLVWITLHPTKGHEQDGTRPALVVSPKIYNQKSGLALVCPITSQQKGYPFEVAVELPKIAGVVLSDQVRSIDWRERKVRFIARAPKTTLHEVAALIGALVDANCLLISDEGIQTK